MKPFCLLTLLSNMFAITYHQIGLCMSKLKETQCVINRGRDQSA